MARNKYSHETLNRLVEEALKQRLKSQDYYLDNLYYISMNGMTDRYREKIDSKLSGSNYLNAMALIETVQSKVNLDVDKFKSLSTKEKIQFFRISNFINTNPKNYEVNETFLKAVGSVAGNHFREAANADLPNEIKQYALLTSKTRERFEKIYMNDLSIIESKIKEVENKPIKKQKLNN